MTTNFTFPTSNIRNTKLFAIALNLGIDNLAFDIATGDFVITLSEPLGWSRGEYEDTPYEGEKVFGINFYGIPKSLRESALTTDQNVPVIIFEDGQYLGNLKTIFDQEYVKVNGREELCVSTTFFLQTPNHISPTEGTQRMAKVRRVVKTHESYLIMR